MSANVIRRGARPPRASQPRRWRLPSRRQLLAGLVVLALLSTGLALWLQVPARLAELAVQKSAAAGLEVRHVSISGLSQVPRSAVYARVFSGNSNAMLATDLAAIRDRLRALPWVADASVRRQLPDTLIIRVEERRPAALWQVRGVHYLIDLDGRVLPVADLLPWNDLPIVIGPGAQLKVRQALALMAASPLARDIDSARLVAGRRWDIQFKTGEWLALPADDAAALQAMQRFAKLDAAQPARLLGGKFSRFDMRLPGRMVVAGPAVADALAEAAKAEKARQQAQKI
jgi:cell division protein FtsQ